MNVATTSRAAYHSKRHDDTQKQRILNALAEFGPLSDSEIMDHTGLLPNVVPPRRGELLAQGIIRLRGEEPRGVEGRMVDVWELTI